ncbi:MAG: hypothetical protein M1823_005948 [Watsoniomyces obsoletus]|nr:MAG: hypothetical protein M1823_005948 [Watsoniomyces obsoletus]
MAETSPQFQKAVEESRKLTAKPTNDELLELYALFKQATQDPPIEESDSPGAFDLKGKAKKRAWQKIVDEGVTPSEAQTRYVELVETLKNNYGFEGGEKEKEL